MSGRTKRARAGGVSTIEDRHNAAVAAFLRAAWGEESSAGSVAEWRAREARANPVERGVEPPKWIFTKGEEVIGYLGTMPARFVVEERETSAHWLKGFWVLREYRSGPVGFAILDRAMADLGMAASTLVAEPARKLMEARGMSDLGLLFNRLRVLRPGRLLGGLDVAGLDMAGLSPIVTGGLRLLQHTRTTGLAGLGLSSATVLATALRGRPSSRVRCTYGWSSVTREDLDLAWEAFRPTIRAASSRAGSMIDWRYRQWDTYDVAAAWDGDVLRGWAIVRRPHADTEGRLKGLWVASLSDILFPLDRPDVGLTVLAAAERLAIRMGADALLCSGTHASLDRVLARRGFVRIPANLHFLVRDPEQKAASIPLREWWLTRGDGRSDEGI